MKQEIFSIIDLIRQQANKRPDNKAVVFKENYLTYAELDNITDRLAAFLNKKGIGKGNVVSVLIPRCEYMEIVSIGILKSGAAYQPLDAAYPFERLDYMIKDAASSLIIVSKDMEYKLQNIDVERFYMDDIKSLPMSGQFEMPQINKEDLFVLLYTSGSTGMPKGCMLEHGNILSFANWYIRYYEVDLNCRMGEHASYVFDVSMMELFMPLTAGACVYIIPEEIRTDLVKLNEFFEQNSITHTSITTQLGRQFAQNIENHSLKHLTVAGEALVPLVPPKNYTLHNGYGPTEGTILLTIQKVDKYYKENVPIGLPLDDVEIYVLDAEGKQVDKGQTGELCAAGRHIARGYLNKKEQTEKVFKKNMFTDKKGYEKIYHTGDYVRYNNDGLLEYLGRMDRQVKIRGFRIELPEVEACLRDIEEIEDATVMAYEEKNGEKYIVAYYVSKDEISDTKISDFMKSKKPKYMIPSYFVRLEEIPLNTNGKIDTKKLPKPDKNKNKAIYEKPQGKWEKIVAQLYEKILNTENVGRNDNFFYLGGHSLLATKFLFEIISKYKCKISVSDIMSNPVVHELAAFLQKKSEKNYLPGQNITHIPDSEFYEASWVQQRIYTAQMLCDNDDISYNLPVIFHISAELVKKINLSSDIVEKIKTSIAKMMSKYEILRTGFIMREEGLVQFVEAATDEWLDKIVEKTYVKLSEPQKELTLKEIIKKEFVKPFSMENPPYFRWSYIKNNDTLDVIFDWHHIISDGNSIELFFREFYMDICGAGIEERGDILQYRDFAAWDKMILKDNLLDEWTRIYGGSVPVLDLKTDRMHSASEKHLGKHLIITLEPDIFEKINKISKQYGVTDYHFLFSAFYLLLYKYTAQKEIVVGTVMNGRMCHEIEKMQGMFVNTVPVLANINDDMTFADFLQMVKKQILFVYEHQQVPLENLAKALGCEHTASGNLMFDILFVMQDFERIINIENQDETYGSAELEFVETDTSMYDITLEAERIAGSYKFDFEYSSELFDDTTIEYMAGHYVELLKSCANYPEKTIVNQNMIDDNERKLLLEDFQGEKIAASDKTVITSMKNFALNTPESTAVVFGDKKLNYLELDTESDKLAALLCQYIDNNEFAVVYAERSMEMIISIWGIIKAGAAYVPVSPEYPDERINFIIDDCKPKVILCCNAKLPEAITQKLSVAGIRIIDISFSDKEKSIICVSENENLILGDESLLKQLGSRKVELNNLAYMIYTSGTTGKPKGVMVEHSQLAHLINSYADIYKLSSKDVVLQFANFVFDQSVWDIFHILAVGGTLCLVPSQIVKEPEKIEKYCEDKGVTAASLTPGFLRLLNPEKLVSLKMLDVGGEVPGEELLTKWGEGRRVFNTYGPTETTVNASSFLFKKDDYNNGNVPIGKAVPNTQIYILHGEKLCGVGVAGELCIAGLGVTKGYWNRESLTKEKYISNMFGNGKLYRSGDLARYLPDGNIEFLGRIDEQVKLHGYRIELGEIEAKITETEYVDKAVVMIRTGADKDKQICAYYTVDERTRKKITDGSLSYEKEYLTKNIITYLKEQLPYYMVPAALIYMEEFPLTVNGKIDKRKLPKPEFNNDREIKAASNEKEKMLVDIWKEILGLKEVGITENFFELGGDSIKAIRMVSKIREAGFDIEVKDIMEYREISQIVLHMTERKAESVKYIYDEVEDITPTPVMWEYMKNDMPMPDYYNQSVMLKFKKKADALAIEKTLYALSFYHGMLRIIQVENKLRIRNTSEDISVPFDIYKCKKNISLEEIKQVCNKAQAGLDTANGIIMRAVLFENEEHENERLLIVIHHLAVDEVSWNILLEDFSKLYLYFRTNTDVKINNVTVEKILPEKTMSFGEWSKLLYENTSDIVLDTEKEYWEKEMSRIKKANDSQSRILGFFKDEAKCHKNKGFKTITKYSSKKAFSNVKQLAEKIYNTRLDVVIMAVLSKTVYGLTGIKELVLEVESHGRMDIGEYAHTERTVGWFTSLYPILAVCHDDIENTIFEWNQAVERVPDFGVSYGILTKENGENVTKPGFVFNFLGIDSSVDYGEFILTDEDTGTEIYEENGDKQTISFNIRGRNDVLEIECCFDKYYDEKKILRLMEMLCKNLENIEVFLNKISHTKVISPVKLCAEKNISINDWIKMKKSKNIENIERINSLTPLQEGMFFHWLGEADSKTHTMYSIQDKIVMYAKWDERCLRDSLELVFEKYEVLRSVFWFKGFEKVYQIFCKKSEPQLIVEHDKTFEQIVQEEQKRGFDLEKEVLFRVYALPINEEKTELLISQHHIIMDGWSFPIVLDEIEKNYMRLLRGEKKEEIKNEVIKEKSNIYSFGDYLNMLSKRSHKKTSQAWEDYLSGYDEQAGIKPVVDLPKNCGVKKAEYRISGQFKNDLGHFAAVNNITMSVLFETTWGLLLQKLNNIDDIVFGKTVSGRNYDIPGIEKSVGMFINTIPVRVRCDNKTTLKQLLKNQQKSSIDMLEWESAGLPEIMDGTGLGGELIQTLYVYENYYIEDRTDSVFEVEGIHEETNYPVTFYVEEGESIILNILYEGKAYTEQFINNIFSYIMMILKQITENCEIKKSMLELLSKKEKENIYKMCKGKLAEYPKKTVMELIKENAYRIPEKTALIFDDKKMSYKALYKKACTVAKKLNVQKGDFVAILADRGIPMIVSALGAMFAGAAYVPISPEYPADRIRYILDDSRPAKLIVAVKDNKIPDDIEKNVLYINNVEDSDETDDEIDIKYETLSNSTAYMIYTSGTTGKPKGVMIDHESLSNMVFANEEYYGFNEQDVVLQMANYVFDQSVWDIFNTLCAGGCLCLISKEKMSTAEKIEDYCKEQGVNVIMTTTVMLGTLHPENMGHMRLVDGGGDAANEEIFKKWIDADRVVNSYGPTETTVNATAFDYYKTKTGYTDRSLSAIPIGKALPNKSVYIMQGDNLCGIGMSGEICILGKGLAQGYWNQSDLTAEKFEKNPFGEGLLYRTGDIGRYLSDGNIYYEGRLDKQIKIRGFRIELGEIEQVIRENSIISEAAVIGIKDASQRNYLVAFYVTKDGKKLSEELLLEWLNKRLPSYMLPSFLYQVDEIFTNYSGKVDSKKFEKYHKDRQKSDIERYEEPDGNFEGFIAQCYKKILGIDRVGRNDSFFELGGTSIDVMKLISKLSDYTLGVEEIFKYSTPKMLGKYIQNEWFEDSVEKNGFVLLKNGEDTKPSWFCLPPSGGTIMCYLKLIQNLDIEGNVYGINDDKYKKYIQMDEDELVCFEKKNLNKTREEYEYETKRNMENYKREILKYWKDGDILVGYSQGGATAFEIAEELEEKGHTVGKIIMLEAEPQNMCSENAMLSRKEAFKMAVSMLSDEKDMYKLDCELEEFFNKMEQQGVQPENWCGYGKYVDEWLKKHTGDKKLLLQTALVIDGNIMYPQQAKGKVNTPIISIVIGDENTDERTQNKWSDYTNSKCLCKVLHTSQLEHIVFLNKYCSEICDFIV